MITVIILGILMKDHMDCYCCHSKCRFSCTNIVWNCKRNNHFTINIAKMRIIKLLWSFSTTVTFLYDYRNHCSLSLFLFNYLAVSRIEPRDSKACFLYSSYSVYALHQFKSLLTGGSNVLMAFNLIFTCRTWLSEVLKSRGLRDLDTQIKRYYMIMIQAIILQLFLVS